MDSMEQRALPASEARARLSELFDLVTENPGTTVCIARPTGIGTAVLVDAVHYELLLLKAELSEKLGLVENGEQASG